MTAKRHGLTIASTMGVLLLIFACKAAVRQNQLQTLDNFTAGETKLESCGVPVDDQTFARARRVIIGDPSLARVAAEVAAAAPAGARGLFFALGGRIVLTRDIDAACRSLPMSKAARTFARENGARMRACWRQAKPGEGPVIYVQATEESIRHALLRSMAFVFTEFFVARASAASRGEEDLAPVTRSLFNFDRRLLRLADALFEDLKGKDATTIARLAEFYGADPRAFRRFVLAEAVDSYYCSADSRERFRLRFPLTYQKFQDLRPDIE